MTTSSYGGVYMARSAHETMSEKTNTLEPTHICRNSDALFKDGQPPLHIKHLLQSLTTVPLRWPWHFWRSQKRQSHILKPTLRVRPLNFQIPLSFYTTVDLLFHLDGSTKILHFALYDNSRQQITWLIWPARDTERGPSKGLSAGRFLRTRLCRLLFFNCINLAPFTFLNDDAISSTSWKMLYTIGCHSDNNLSMEFYFAFAHEWGLVSFQLLLFGARLCSHCRRD